MPFKEAPVSQGGQVTIFVMEEDDGFRIAEVDQ
jgi:hypothetical protein